MAWDWRTKPIWIGQKYSECYSGYRRGHALNRSRTGKRWGEDRIAYKTLPRIARNCHYSLKARRWKRTGEIHESKWMR